MYPGRLGPARAGFWRCAACGVPNPEASYVTHCIGCGAPRPHAMNAARGPGRSRPGRWAAVASWAYLAAVIVVWGVRSVLGDRWWPATILLL